jgi:hypothetical protein
MMDTLQNKVNLDTETQKQRVCLWDAYNQVTMKINVPGLI